MGAREFQRFLLDKQREITAVVADARELGRAKRAVLDGLRGQYASTRASIGASLIHSRVAVNCRQDQRLGTVAGHGGVATELRRRSAVRLGDVAA